MEKLLDPLTISLTHEAIARCRPQAGAIVRRALGYGHPDVEDLVQEAMLRSLTASRAAPIQAPGAYVATTTRCVLVDYFRRKRTRKEVINLVQRETRPESAAEPPPLDDVLELKRVAGSLPGFDRVIASLGLVFSARDLSRLLGIGRTSAGALMARYHVELAGRGLLRDGHGKRRSAVGVAGLANQRGLLGDKPAAIVQ